MPCTYKIKTKYSNGKILTSQATTETINSQIREIIRFRHVSNLSHIEVYKRGKLIWHKNIGTLDP